MNGSIFAQASLKSVASVSAQANLREQVMPQPKHLFTIGKLVCLQANSRSDVKRGGRSQNSSLQKGLPA